jgi:hypothetical protein
MQRVLFGSLAAGFLALALFLSAEESGPPQVINAQATPTPPASQWVDRPPSTPGATNTCPAAGQWLLVYWSGAENTAIATAAGVCPDAAYYWVSRSGRWLGFSKASQGASDSWQVLTGEAHFVRGQ